MKMKCNKSQMATLTMWKIFMALALVMPVTLAHQHSMAGGAGGGGGSSGHGTAMGMGAASGLGKEAHGKFARCFVCCFPDYFKWASSGLQRCCKECSGAARRRQ